MVRKKGGAMLTTTLKLLRKHDACKDRYAHLRKAIGSGYGDDTPIPLTKILDLNGLDDALWALRAVPESQAAERDKQARLFACRCVRETPIGDGRKVWDLLTDDRSKKSVEVAEQFSIGNASDEELDAAWDAARVAARVAAWDAAWDAARDAAREHQSKIFVEMFS
jgi:hypothetical protein